MVLKVIESEGRKIFKSKDVKGKKDLKESDKY